MGVKGTILLLALLIVLSSGLLACSPQQDTSQSRHEEMFVRIDRATARGMHYLSTAYNGTAYQDSYLQYVYLGEQIACPLAEDCTITYRLLDAYFDVSFLQEAGVDMAPIKDQQEDARRVLAALAKLWENEKINNVKRSTGEGGVALDTYCILGTIEKDRRMAAVVASYLDENDDWMPPTYYTSDLWRNIADESWCIRLFVTTGYEKELTTRLVVKLVNDTEAFRTDENISDQDKLAAIYHTLYVLSDYEKILKDKRFHANKMGYADFISYFSYKNLAGNTLMTANLLDVMVYAEYDNPGAVAELAEAVLLQQEENGMWRMAADAEGDSVQVFTTFRALIGLNQYKKTLR